MTDSPSPSIKEPGVEAEIQLGDPTELALRGSADIAISTALDALITRLHDELVARGARVVVVDLLQLEFMNASAFNVLVNWLGLVQDLPPAQRYRLTFRSNT